MTIISQIIVVLLIGLTGMIILYANRGLSSAAEEGEHFVDEWAIRQVRKEEKKLEKVKRKELRNPDSDVDPYADSYPPEEEVWEEDSWAIRQQQMPQNPVVRKAGEFQLIQYDENRNVVRSVPVDHYPFYIGRSKENDLEVNDLYIAKKHCRIVEKDGRILVEDLGSANKIFAEGRVNSQYILSDGCHFYLGSCEFQMKKMDHRSQATILASKPERMSL